MPSAVGLDLLLDDIAAIRGRTFGLLSQQAAVDLAQRPAHIALSASGARPKVLFAPEHGYYGVEQDMVAADSSRDPITGCEVVSLYGNDEHSLRPRAGAFDGLDLLVIDLQDIGSRYYTYAATAVWAAQAARQTGCDVWVLDRPNPLGGTDVEGNLRDESFASFVGAFQHPVRHGLTMAEILLMELGVAASEVESSGVRVWPADWSRGDHWPATGRPWVAPSPNMPSHATAAIYPGLCLVEATEISEGRGTTRPFHLVGHPALDPQALADGIDRRWSAGLSFVPTYFRPQFQKHAGEVCGGVEIVVTDPQSVDAYRFGLHLLLSLRRALGDRFAWRHAPYEFVVDRPAIDLLTGGEEARRAIDGGDSVSLEEWWAGFAADEADFRVHREPYLLYSG